MCEIEKPRIPARPFGVAYLSSDIIAWSVSKCQSASSCELTDPHTEALLLFLDDLLGDNEAHKVQVLSCARQWFLELER